MKKIEFVQSAYNGGFPCANGDGFEHGEGVYVVSKKDLDELEKSIKNIVDALQERVSLIDQQLEELKPRGLMNSAYSEYPSGVRDGLIKAMKIVKECSPVEPPRQSKKKK